MRLEVLGCAGGSAMGRRPTCFVVDDEVAVDAGALAQAMPVERQRRLQHVLVSHAHLDHVLSLPLLLDNRFDGPPDHLRLYAFDSTFRDLERGLFNGRVWPELITLQRSKAVSVELVTIAAGVPFAAGPLRVTAHEMEHPIPCAGFLLESSGESIFIAGDTGSATGVKRAVADAKGLRAIVIEVSWPDRLRELAQRVGHLTPSMLASTWPLHPKAKTLVTHIKPAFLDEVTAELEALGVDLEILRDGQLLDL